MVISAGGDEKFLTETKCMGRENFWGCCKVLIFSLGVGYTCVGFNVIHQTVCILVLCTFYLLHFLIKMFIERQDPLTHKKCLKPQKYANDVQKIPLRG